MNQFFVGLDLGQARDYTAIAIIERVQVSSSGEQPLLFKCVYLERLPLGTPYPAQVARVKALLATPELKDKCQLVADATGCGRPVIDMLRAAGLAPVAVTITGGDTVSYVDGFTRVPKRDLVGVLQVTLQDKRLRLADDLPNLETLQAELLNFKAKITASANDTYGAGSDWREGAHDDTVLAVALALWKANLKQRAALQGAQVIEMDWRTLI